MKSYRLVSKIFIFVALNFALTNAYGEEVTVNTFNYCTITCNGKKHTMCEYPEGGPQQCRSFKHGLSHSMKTALLEMHNYLRQQVAMGKGNNGEPQASNMAALQWSVEAEMIAQRWADQCMKINAKDECRTSSENLTGGQNLINTFTKTDVDLYFFQKNTVLDWFNTGKEFDKNLLQKYEYSKNSSQYTQIIWAKTLFLGCGFSNGELNGTKIWRLVCNYYPAGNVVGMPVYEEGRPCGQCPRGCDKPSWPELCAPAKNTVHNWENSASTRQGARLSHCVVVVALVFIVFTLIEY